MLTWKLHYYVGTIARNLETLPYLGITIGMKGYSVNWCPLYIPSFSPGNLVKKIEI